MASMEFNARSSDFTLIFLKSLEFRSRTHYVQSKSRITFKIVTGFYKCIHCLSNSDVASER